VGLERGPLSLVSTTEELLGRKNSDSGLETREYGLHIVYSILALINTAKVRQLLRPRTVAHGLTRIIVNVKILNSSLSTGLELDS
jgi:hypothetical protein